MAAGETTDTEYVSTTRALLYRLSFVLLPCLKKGARENRISSSGYGEG